MIRVARIGVVLIEPNDGSIPSHPRAAAVRLVRNGLKKLLGKPVVKDGFEATGNYIYSVSRREIEKFALGLGLRHLAFNGYNDHYVPGVEYELLADRGPLFQAVRKKVAFRDRLCRLGLIEPSLLAAVILKPEPAPQLAAALRALGFVVITLPENPYAKPALRPPRGLTWTQDCEKAWRMRDSSATARPWFRWESRPRFAAPAGFSIIVRPVPFRTPARAP
jgi:hypothetical protein